MIPCKCFFSKGWERCKALESILNDLNIGYKTETVRKNDTRDKKKLKNDTLYYLFDELDSSDCELDENTDSELNEDKKIQKQPYVYLHDKKSSDRKVKKVCFFLKINFIFFLE